MFIVEQYNTAKVKNQTKNKVLLHGTLLAKGKPVKMRFTYREFTLIVGILVALIVVFAVWFNQQPQAAAELPSLPEVLDNATSSLSPDTILKKIMTKTWLFFSRSAS